MFQPYVRPDNPHAYVERLRADEQEMEHGRELRRHGHHIAANFICVEHARRLQRDVRLLPAERDKMRLACIKDAMRAYLEAGMTREAERLIGLALPHQLAEVEAVMAEADALSVAYIPF